jgi:hypothetical protein
MASAPITVSTARVSERRSASTKPTEAGIFAYASTSSEWVARLSTV